MTPWLIGDVQGCCDQLEKLVQRILERNPDACLYFTGDLVNRGPRSLASLRFVHALGERAHTVLGNHDLNLLAVAAGIREARKGDTLDDILQAPDRDELLDWLRHRPLALTLPTAQGDALLVHGGIWPQWSAVQTLVCAQEVEHVLQSDGWMHFLREMYGNTPAQWHNELQGIERWRAIVNGLTRMRFCDAQGTMDFSSKEGIHAPEGFLPWFDIPWRATATTRVVFGHWSTLGLVLRPNLVSADTGCVWGGHLTGICLDNDFTIQIACTQQQVPGKS